jgi:DNA-binding CsgD family transcriptional regulator
VDTSIEDLESSLGSVTDAARRLRGVQQGLGRLCVLPSLTRLVAAAPAELCARIGLARAMLSRLQGDRIVFVSMSDEADPVAAADFARLARAVRPRLEICAPEHEAVIRQMPVLVAAPLKAEGAGRPFTDVPRTSSYVVAPIVVGTRTVGLLHADGFDTGAPPTVLDRQLVWTFATGVGWAMERFASKTDGGSAELHDLLDIAVSAAVDPRDDLGVEWRLGDRFPTLNIREQQVLTHMAQGASNETIASALVISQATVKSHVRNILRKLDVNNRTEAVSLYLARRSPSRRQAEASSAVTAAWKP